MKVNRYTDHILVLPEDDANRQIANVFMLNLDIDNARIQIMPSAGGWTKVIEDFERNYLSGMRNKYNKRLVVLLTELDRDPNRLDRIKEKIPEDLADRIFILGVLSEPEDLRQCIGKSFEQIAKDLARDCPIKSIPYGNTSSLSTIKRSWNVSPRKQIRSCFPRNAILRRLFQQQRIESRNSLFCG